MVQEEAARFCSPEVVLPQVMRAPEPLNAPAVSPVHELARRGTTPVSESPGHAVVWTSPVGVDTVPTVQVPAMLTVDEEPVLPPLKLLVVALKLVAPVKDTAAPFVTEGPMSVR